MKWKLTSQLLFVESRISEIPAHNRNTQGSSSVCTVIANCAWCIQKQVNVIVNISDYREYICFDPDFENVIINRIPWYLRPFLDQCLHECGLFGLYKCLDAPLLFSFYLDTLITKNAIELIDWGHFFFLANTSRKAYHLNTCHWQGIHNNQILEQKKELHSFRCKKLVKMIPENSVLLQVSRMSLLGSCQSNELSA